MNALFKFEDESGDGLRCVPMAVRMKLDRAGVKLDLRAWVKFTEEERRELLALPAGDGGALEAYGARARALARERTGEEPKALSVPPAFPWDDAASLPPDVADKAAAEGARLTAERWTALAPLQRFALIKLSRPSHENRNFLPACREFGLL